MTTNKLGLYLHIPFCERKCNYCDFNSYCYSAEVRRKYVDSLLKEIKMESNFYNEYIVDTIFIGGGTPTLLSNKEIVDIVQAINECFNIDNDLEFTIEANPNSVTKEKLKTYIEIGINRISFGVQSFIDKELKILGRLHNKKDIYDGVKKAKDVGFSNINIDLMTSIPHQTLESFRYSLEEALKLDVQHLSCYSLILEEGTLFGKSVSEGMNLNLPDEDSEREIYYYLIKELERHGFYQYEISNFSKVNYQSKHNLKYWRCDDYLGLGLGSHSRISETRIEKIDNMDGYLEQIELGNLPIGRKIALSKLDQINEKIIMGIRLTEGIDIIKLNNEFNINFLQDYAFEIDKNVKNGYIEIDDNKLKLSKLGFDFSNSVELDFYRL